MRLPASARPGHAPSVQGKDAGSSHADRSCTPRGWRRERWPLIPRSEAAAARIAPDWVCEILSGSTAKSDRLRKVPLYHRHGVPHLWLVNPLLQTVEVFRHSEPGYMFLATYCDSDLLRAEPFEALDLDLSEIWPEPELLPPPSVPEF